MELVACTYEVDDFRLTGFLADGATSGSVPGVLIAHEAPGVTAHVKERARMLAERGYVAFALDMYGQVDLPINEAQEQSRTLMADAALMRRRARAALDLLASQSHCDATKLAAVGFCLGGIAHVPSCPVVVRRTPGAAPGAPLDKLPAPHPDP
ncbi:MAG: dienelactone hydrolase family protein [Steroidobacteraceae bacterium]